MAAEFPEGEIPEDDIEFVKDLGLVVRGPRGLEIANPIYREVIPRALTSVTEDYLPVDRDGRRDAPPPAERTEGRQEIEHDERRVTVVRL